RSASRLDRGADVRHRARPRRADRGARARALRPASGGDLARPRPPPSDFREDGRLRALRPRGPRLHLGAHGQGRRAQGCCGGRGRNRSPLTFTPRTRPPSGAFGTSTFTLSGEPSVGTVSCFAVPGRTTNVRPSTSTVRAEVPRGTASRSPERPGRA